MDAKRVYADDLMVDDWVSLKETGDDYPASNYQISFKNLMRLDYGSLEAEAIPLTDEILEKNGFHKANDWGGTFKIKDGLELVFAGMYSMHSYEFYGYEGLNHGSCTGIYIDYVHELQHVLKQCEIEKKIIV